MDTNHLYGMTWQDSLVTFDHATSSWRMSQQSLAFTEGPSTAEFLETWPKWGIMLNGIVWELPMSERCTGDGAGSSSVGYPTPNTTDRDSNRSVSAGSSVRLTLKGMAKHNKWPTPRASEWKGTGPIGSKSHKHMMEKGYLCAKAQDREQRSGQLSHQWVNWLMGFPPGWLDLTTDQP